MMSPFHAPATYTLHLARATMILAAAFLLPSISLAQHHAGHGHGHHGHHGGGISSGNFHHHHGGGYHSGSYYGGNGFYGGLYGPSISLNFRSSAYPGAYYAGSSYYAGQGFYGQQSLRIQSYNVRPYALVPSPVYVAPQYSPPPVFRSSPTYPLGGATQQSSVVVSPTATDSPAGKSEPTSSESEKVSPAMGDTFNGELRPGMVLPDGSVVISVQPLSGEVVPQGTTLPPSNP